MSNTKEEILITALHLFAADGYEAVSVSKIAGELGMTKGALYKHYRNKRHIFDSITERMEQKDAENAERFQMPEGLREDMQDKYSNASVQYFIEYSKAQFRYWTCDDFAASFRRMLTVEQYRSGKMQKLYQQYLASGPVGYVADLFDSMEIEAPEQKAAEFYGILFIFYSIYDGIEDKERVIQLCCDTIDDFADRELRQKKTYLKPAGDRL